MDYALMSGGDVVPLGLLLSRTLLLLANAFVLLFLLPGMMNDNYQAYHFRK
jgi:hypothetical protein